MCATSSTRMTASLPDVSFIADKVKFDSIETMRGSEAENISKY